MYIKLTNPQKRTADLYLVSLNQPKQVRSVILTQAGPVEPERKAVLARKPNWAGQLTPEAIADSLIKEDREIDTNRLGQPVVIKSSAFLDATGQMVTQFRVVEDKYLPNGTIKESITYKATEPNIDFPLQIAAKGHQKPDEMFQKFVVHKIYQLIHTDNLSFDFLYNLCKEVQPLGFVRLAAGLKGNEPLVLKKEGAPCFAFLRGQVKDNTYCATMHLSYMGLALPTPVDPVPATT